MNIFSFIYVLLWNVKMSGFINWRPALSEYLFDGEVIDQVVVVFVEAAVQGDAVGVKEQILRKAESQ